MGEKEPEEEKKKRRAEALIGDFISEREELREVPRFHVPPFVERKIEGTRTVVYMPVDAGRLDAPGKVSVVKAAPPAEVSPPARHEAVASTPEPPLPAMAAVSQPATAPRPATAPEPDNIPGPAAEATPEPAAVWAQPPAASPPPPAGPATQAPFEFPAKLMTGPSGPASFRRPYMRPDTSGPRKTSLQALPRRPSAKDLIARLRVVREGVETKKEAFQGKAEAVVPPAPPMPAEAEPETSMAAATPIEPAAAKELEQKAEGGKLCPSCGSPISDKNRLLICTGCGKMSCDSCNRYELAHMKADIYYDYQFDFPLCIQCYGKAFSIQRLLGRAGVCYGNGNYSYALYYANQALEQDPESIYASRARDIIAKTNKAHEQSQERDKEWRLQRKQFATSRLRQEDPGWR